MVESSLVKYIQEYHEQGYSIPTLRDYLITQGYAREDVEKAITEAYQPQHGHHKKLAITFGIVAVLVLLVSLAILLFPLLQEPTTLQMNAQPASSAINLGQSLSFSTQLASTGDAVPLTLAYSVSQNGEEVDTGTRTTNTGVASASFTTTPQAPGEYRVTLTATFEDQQRTSTFTFTVQPVCGDAICSDGETCPEDCITCGDGVCSPGEVCTQDCAPDAVCGDAICQADETAASCPQDCATCGDGICQDDESQATCPEDCTPISECGDAICQADETAASCPQDCIACGDGICEEDETDRKCPEDCAQEGINALSQYELTTYVPEQVENNGARAVARECDTIIDLETRDTCYFLLMKASRDAEYCQQITLKSTTEDCLVTYAVTTNDYAVCGDIQDQYKRQSCDQLQQRYELQQQYQNT